MTITTGANSHKLLEYLAFGKIVVSNKVSTYLDKYPEIVKKINMVHEETNSTFIDLFRDAVENLDIHNSFENQEYRIKFANQFTYEEQVKKIDKEIFKLLNANS